MESIKKGDLVLVTFPAFIDEDDGYECPEEQYFMVANCLKGKWVYADPHGDQGGVAKDHCKTVCRTEEMEKFK